MPSQICTPEVKQMALPKWSTHICTNNDHWLKHEMSYSTFWQWTSFNIALINKQQGGATHCVSSCRWQMLTSNSLTKWSELLNSDWYPRIRRTIVFNHIFYWDHEYCRSMRTEIFYNYIHPNFHFFEREKLKTINSKQFSRLPHVVSYVTVSSVIMHILESCVFL